MNEEQNLRALNSYLKPTGRTKLLTQSVGQLGLKSYTLTYQTEGKIPVTWPVTGNCDFSLSFSELANNWIFTGSMFGVTPGGNDVKTWFHEVSRGVKSQELALSSVLQRSLTIWERYRGDLDQFANRLGTELAAIGHTSKTDFGYCWTHTAHPDIRICFSPDTVKPGYGQLPQVKFGFFEPTKLHVWYLSLDNLLKMRNAIKDYTLVATAFCEGASSCINPVLE